jgi:hypothetical protein
VKYGTAGGFPTAEQGAALGGGQYFFAGGTPAAQQNDPNVAMLTQN